MAELDRVSGSPASSENLEVAPQVSRTAEVVVQVSSTAAAVAAHTASTAVASGLEEEHVVSSKHPVADFDSLDWRKNDAPHLETLCKLLTQSCSYLNTVLGCLRSPNRRTSSFDRMFKYILNERLLKNTTFQETRHQTSLL